MSESTQVAVIAVVALLAATLGCGQESPVRDPADIVEAQAARMKPVADATPDGAASLHSVMVVQAQAAHRLAMARCDAEHAAARNNCKALADADLAAARANATAAKIASDPKS